MNDDYDPLEGLSDETIHVIKSKITPEMGMAFVNLFSKEFLKPILADEVRRLLGDYPWYPQKSRESQIRFTRRLRDWAIANDHPICSTNDGYFYGNHELIMKAARRARGQAAGEIKRAERLERLAAKLLPREKEQEQKLKNLELESSLMEGSLFEGSR